VQQFLYQTQGLGQDEVVSRLGGVLTIECVEKFQTENCHFLTFGIKDKISEILFVMASGFHNTRKVPESLYSWCMIMHGMMIGWYVNIMHC